MGRTSIIMVMAFNLIFMTMGFRLSSLTSSAYDKYMTYYSIEQAGLAAESGANIAISNSYWSRWTALPTAQFSSGTGIQGTIQFADTAVSSSSGSGDTIGFHLTSTASDNYSTVITRVSVQGQSFAQFGIFNSSENGISWGASDTCFGPYHTQDNMTCQGTPRFYGQVTTNGSITGGSPYFKFPPTPKTNIPLDGSFDDLKAWGSTAKGGANYTGVKVFVEFYNNGQIKVQTVTNASTSDGWLASGTGFSTGSIKACTTYANVGELTSSGVLLVNNSELHVKGVLENVNLTLGCIGTGSIVMIDSSLVYKESPPDSRNKFAVTNSMLGIVAQNGINVTDTQHPSTSTTQTDGVTPTVKNYAIANNNNNNNLKGVTINATMYSSNGGFGAENFKTRGDCGTLRVVGGIQELTREAVKYPSTGDGFDKSYDYDLNLQYNTPKGYPSTRFLIKNWVDSTIITNNTFWQGENQ